MNKLTTYIGAAASVLLLSCAATGGKKQGAGEGDGEVRVSPSQRVMVVTNGEAVFKRYSELSADYQHKIDRAITIAYQELMRARAADPSGSLATEPFQDQLWCKVDVIEGALGVGCGIFGYWCSVWIHPDKGVAANCGGS